MSQWLQEIGGLAGLGILAARWILIGFSVASIGVMFERAASLRKTCEAENRDFQTLRTAIRAGQNDAVRACAAKKDSPVAACVRAGLDDSDLGETAMRDAMNQEVSMQSAELNRNLPILATVASVAPYIGLFGTVLGILDAFGKIAATGQTGARVVAAPISEALIATALGLGVAIPAVIAYNYFVGRIHTLVLQIEDHTLELAARLPHLVGAKDHEKQ